MRVVGNIAAGQPAASELREVVHPTPPAARGHLPDHTVQYTLDALPTSGDHAELAGWIRNAAPDAAAGWAASPYLFACNGPPCPTNRNGDEHGNEVTLKIASTGCGALQFVACLTKAPTSGGVENRLVDNREMIFSPSPFYEERLYAWTDVENRHGTEIYGVTYLWVKAALRHEFGHTFGLDHTPEDQSASYHGIMKASLVYGGLADIRDDDKAVVKQIYRGHVRDQGW